MRRLRAEACLVTRVCQTAIHDTVIPVPPSRTRSEFRSRAAARLGTASRGRSLESCLRGTVMLASGERAAKAKRVSRAAGLSELGRLPASEGAASGRRRPACWARRHPGASSPGSCPACWARRPGARSEACRLPCLHYLSNKRFLATQPLDTILCWEFL